MLDKKDLDAIEKMFDRKFTEVEDRLDKKIDTKFGTFETKMNDRMDAKFEEFEIEMNERIDSKFKDFKEQFSLELSDVLHDITTTIDYRFNKMEEKLNKRFAVQDKKIDLLLEYSNENIRKHDEYDRNFSRIDSKLLNHDLRLHSLEARSATAI